jgi:hypothetical protein
MLILIHFTEPKTKDYIGVMNMSHKDNKNSKDNKKAGQKTKKELKKMEVEMANEIGYSNESRKLGKDKKGKTKKD